jgi:predicted  nucleic acid-binding Zn-ribbon protein
MPNTNLEFNSDHTLQEQLWVDGAEPAINAINLNRYEYALLSLLGSGSGDNNEGYIQKIISYINNLDLTQSISQNNTTINLISKVVQTDGKISIETTPFTLLPTHIPNLDISKIYDGTVTLKSYIANKISQELSNLDYIQSDYINLEGSQGPIKLISEISETDGKISVKISELHLAADNIPTLTSDKITHQKNSLSATLNTQNASITALNQTLSTKTSELETSIGDLHKDTQTAISNLESNIESDIGTINSSLASINTEISGLKSTTHSANTNITELQSDVSQLNESVKELKSENISGIKNDVSSIQDDVEDLLDRVGKVEVTIEELDTDNIKNIKDNVEDLLKDVSQIEENIRDLDSSKISNDDELILYCGDSANVTFS